MTTMAVDELMELASVEGGGWSGTGAPGTVWDTVPEKGLDLDSCSNIYGERFDQALLDGSMDPVHVDTAVNMAGYYGIEITPDREDLLVMGNGHHRVIRAWQLGIARMRITTDYYASGADYRADQEQADEYADASV